MRFGNVGGSAARVKHRTFDTHLHEHPMPSRRGSDQENFVKERTRSDGNIQLSYNAPMPTTTAPPPAPPAPPSSSSKRATTASGARRKEAEAKRSSRSPPSAGDDDDERRNNNSNKDDVGAPTASGGRVAYLQSQVEEWRRRRDAAQMVFMQENSAVERTQRSIEQAKARVAKKNQLLLQYAPPPPPPQEETAAQESSGAAGDESSSRVAGTAAIDSSSVSQQQQQHHHHGHHHNSNNPNLPPPKRDGAAQCDAAFCALSDFSHTLDVNHRENLLALQLAKRTLVDATLQQNVRLAEEVAALVQRAQLMERELYQQCDRFRLERLPPEQVCAAENLVQATVGGPLHSSSMLVENAADVSFTAQQQHGGGRGVDAEAVYRTVERARLALTQALVPQTVASHGRGGGRTM